MERRRYRGEPPRGRGEAYYSSISRKRTGNEASVTTDMQDEHQFPQLGGFSGSDGQPDLLAGDVNYGTINFAKPTEEQTEPVISRGWVAAFVDSSSNGIVWKDHANNEVQLSSASLLQEHNEWKQRLRSEIREHATQNDRAKQDFLDSYGYDMYKKYYGCADYNTDSDDNVCDNEDPDLDYEGDY